jgi:hypothetical protein
MILLATLVAYNTFNALGQRMIDGRLLNVVLVLMLTSSVLGPILTERFAVRLQKDAIGNDKGDEHQSRTVQ